MKIKIGNKTFEVSKEVLESNPEEVSIEFDGTLRTQEEEATYYNNIKSELHKAGVETAVKQYRDEYGFEGRSIDKLIEAVQKKALEDAKIEPAEQLKKIKQTLEEKETALQNALSKVSEKENEFNQYKKTSTIDNTLDGWIPENTILPKEDIKLILKTKLKFDTDENNNIISLDASGNIIKDPTTANPVSGKDVVSNFFKDNQSYLKPIEGGAGGGDSSSKGKKKSLDDFIKEQQDKGVKPNSPEFTETLNKQVEAGLLEVE